MVAASTVGSDQERHSQEGQKRSTPYVKTGSASQSGQAEGTASDNKAEAIVEQFHVQGNELLRECTQENALAKDIAREYHARLTQFQNELSAQGWADNRAIQRSGILQWKVTVKQLLTKAPLLAALERDERAKQVSTNRAQKAPDAPLPPLALGPIGDTLDGHDMPTGMALQMKRPEQPTVSRSGQPKRPPPRYDNVAPAHEPICEKSRGGAPGPRVSTPVH